MTLRKIQPTTRDNASRALVAEAAYFMWLREGMGHGRDLEHWLQAERDHAAGSSSASNVRVRKRSRKQPDSTTNCGRVYRLRFLTQSGTTRHVMAVSAANDADALVEAEHVRDGRRLEVWRGKNCIGALPSVANARAA